MIIPLPDRTCLHERHRLSHQQIDRWLGENRSKEFLQEKIKRLEAVRNFLSVTDLLRANGLPFVCLKGPMLSLRIYGDPAVRFSCDIDLLIGPEQLEPTLKVMNGNGFQTLRGELWPREKIRRDLLLKNLHHISLFNPELKYCVEIHWTLMHGMPVTQKAMADLVARNLTHMQYAGREFTVLNRELELTYLMIHGSKHGWARLKWLVDINDYPLDGIDREAISGIIGLLHAWPIVTLTNYFLKKYFGKQLPFNGPERIPAYSVKYVQKNIDKPGKYPAIPDFIREIRYLWTLFPQFSYKVKLIRERFLCQDDLLGHSFSFRILYYVYRPYSYVKRRILHV
jgi:hypothetical protein